MLEPRSNRFDPSPRRRLACAPTAILFGLFLLVGPAADAQATGKDGAVQAQERPRRGIGLSLLTVDLPFDLEARVGGLYTRSRYAIDALAYDRWLDPGPAVQRDSLIESRVSVGREVFSGIELEVAWGTQTPLSFRSLSGPDRQTVGAYFRFAH